MILPARLSRPPAAGARAAFKSSCEGIMSSMDSEAPKDGFNRFAVGWFPVLWHKG